jgi:hypothetical protein
MAVKRFVLDTSTLNDDTTGLDGPSPAFTLDTSILDGNGLLDGVDFLVEATGEATLGAMSATATATITHIATAEASLGGLSSTATAMVSHSATASATLGDLVGSATSVVVISATASATLGAMTATADSTPTILPIFEAELGALSSTATATVITPTPAEPTPTGGRMVYSRQPRKKLEPVVQVIEIPVIQPKRRYGVASTSLSAMQAQAESTITFSILEDDAELLLML